MKSITIYTWSSCPFCKRAKSFFDEREIAYTELEMTGKDKELQALREKYKWRTVPMILVGDTFIGGCDDLMGLDARGKLEALLSD